MRRLPHARVQELDYCVPPGDILKEIIEARNMTQAELAKRCGLSPKTISKIIAGQAPIEAGTAIALQRVLNVHSDIWNNLQTIWETYREREREKEEMHKRVEWAKRFPVRELVQMKKEGLIGIDPPKNEVDKVTNILTFFGVRDKESFDRVYQGEKMVVNFRHTPKFKSDPHALWAWLRIGEIKAQNISCQEYNEERFRAALKDIRGLTRESVDVFVPRMVELCAKAGVAVCFVPPFRKTKLAGAARWISPKKALIQLSLRGKSVDIFWWTFFHEAGHILLHQKKNVFFDGDERGDGQPECEADDFAREFLIPQSVWEGFRQVGHFSRSVICGLAESQGISPSIVLGRLQHENLVSWKTHLNDLKYSLDFKQENRR
ncbi:MAG: HigA family addiction module antitoxin [bacterium]